MSIRTRLAVAIALVLAVALALVGLVLVRGTRATLVDQVDDAVRDSAGRAESRPLSSPKIDHGRTSGGDGTPEASDPPTPTADGEPSSVPRPIARFVFSPSGNVLRWELCGYADDPKPPPRLPEVPSPALDRLIGRIVTVPAVEGAFAYRMLVQRGPSGTVLMTAAPLDAADAAVARLVRTLLVVGAVALAAGTLASWWLIRRGLRPVDRMVETAAAIAAGDLSRRVPDADPRTELGRLGGALNEMLGRIERSARARAASEERLRRFVADAAHELRTPLTSLRGYAELYRQGALPDEAATANAMGRIESEGARMARLVDDLLLLARLDQQRGLETEPVDLVGLVREAVADFRAVSPDRPLTEDLAETAIVRGDGLRLRQIVDNLLANARTHTPPGTPVRVTVIRGADHVEVAIADEGPGIAPDDQRNVFDRFWRADPARTRGRGGTGLGLAIVASLVEAHSGTVEVASGPGRGATFAIRLPLAKGAGAAPNATPTARPAQPTVARSRFG